MGTKLKMLWIGMALVFALVLTLGLSAFVFALPNESFNLSGELSYEGGPQVVKYYWSEEVTADGQTSQNLKLFDDGTLKYEIEITMGSQTIGVTMGGTYTKGEIAYLLQPTSFYNYVAVDGIISEELEWNEEDGENEVYEEVEEAFVWRGKIYEHVAHFGDFGWFFEDGYVPSETDQPLSGHLASERNGLSNYFTGLTGTETLGEIRSSLFNSGLTFVLDKTDPDNQNMPEVVHTYSFQLLKLDGVEATDNTVVSLGYHIAEVSFEYNGQTYTMLVDFVTTN